jgi:small subunit ribosomal protein S16
MKKLIVDHDSMPVRLRLSLHGHRNNRIFHLVAIDLRKRRDAKPIELLGIYDPRLRLGQEHKTMYWSVERIMYWLKKGGALPSKTVVKLLERVRSLFFSRPFRILKGGPQGGHHSPGLKISSKIARCYLYHIKRRKNNLIPVRATFAFMRRTQNSMGRGGEDVSVLKVAPLL